MKKLCLIVMITAILGVQALVAQDFETAQQQEQDSGAVKGLSVYGAVWARGWAGARTNGADLKNSDTYIAFQYNFTNYSGVVFTLNANGAVANTNTSTNYDSSGTVTGSTTSTVYYLRANLGDVFAYTDVLREFGIKAAGIKIQAGKFNIGNTHYNPGSFGTGNDAITASDRYNVDLLNLLIEIDISRDIVPLVLRVGGDLDFGFYQGTAGEGLGFLQNNGYSLLTELNLDDMQVADNVVLGANVYAVVSNSSLNLAGDYLVNSKPDLNVGGTFGITILNLPVNLKFGGSVNYYKVYDYDLTNNIYDIEQTGVGAQFAISVSMDNLFFASGGYKYDPLHNAGHWLGIKGQLTKFKYIQPYLGWGFRVLKALPGTHFFDYSGLSAGVEIAPLDYVSIYVGWNRTGVHGVDLDPQNPTTTGSLYPHSDSEIYSPTYQDGWGAIYITFSCTF